MHQDSEYKRQKACELQLLASIERLQYRNETELLYGAVSPDQLFEEISSTAFTDASSIGFEVFARAGINMKLGKPEQGSERYGILREQVLTVLQPYLDSLMKKGYIIPEEIADISDGGTLTHYWYAPIV